MGKASPNSLFYDAFLTTALLTLRQKGRAKLGTNASSASDWGLKEAK